LIALREYAARRGFVLVGQYIDYASGRRDDRPQYQALFKAARTRQIDVVLVWRYDRFARSTQALVNALKEFQHLGVDFISYQENIDTTTAQGELIFTVMASLAQFESALISEWVKAGMARAKAQGRRISRAPIAKKVQAHIAMLYAQGRSITHISKQLGISYGTAWTRQSRTHFMTTPVQGFLEKRKVKKRVRGEPHVVEAITPPCTTAKNCPFATRGPRGVDVVHTAEDCVPCSFLTSPKAAKSLMWAHWRRL
jgi:DNA invertase Pin-like site-specific DNA recombinase